MADFCPVAPIQVLEAMYDDNPHTFGEHHLLLAHHTDEYLNRFTALFKRIASDRIIQPLVIMDNSVVELGGYVDVNMMRRVCEALMAVAGGSMELIAVLPDVMGDGEATRVAVHNTYGDWTFSLACHGFMAVCQGRTIADFNASVLEFTHQATYDEINWLGIPRILTKNLGSRREATLSALQLKLPNQRIHLLGYSDDVLDDIECSLTQGIATIDSAVPLRYPGQWHALADAGPRPKDWFETAQFDAQMKANLAHARLSHLPDDFETAEALLQQGGVIEQ